MKQVLVQILFFVVLIGWSIPVTALDKEEKAAIEAIKAGDPAALKSYLDRHPDVNCEFSNGKTGMYYAIEYGQDNICRFLLERGADPDFIVEDRTLLNWAIRYNRERIIRYLIEYGAQVNKTDEHSDSPLICAAKFNNLEICSILVNRGADPLYKNAQGKRASDYAGNYYGSPACSYLLKMEKMYEARDSVPSYKDGPYIFYEGEDRIVMTYFEHDQEKGLTRLTEKTFETGSSDTVLRGFGWDIRSYHLSREFPPDSNRYSTTADIFVFGDIHGRYDALINTLIHHKVIDSGHRWIFGAGHLVLLGDVFDRGAFVTETLWFLYDLEFQARKSGGEVHLLLGNHEIMELTGDDRYLNDKYRYFTQYTGLDYYRLLEKNTVLGKWLRSKNAIVRINDNLFVHAGISPQFAINDQSVSEINERVHQYLHSDYGVEKGSKEDMILGSIGPFWYRGYIGLPDKFPEVTQEFVDEYLDSQGLKRMIIGHNEQKAITTSYNGRIISTDVEIIEDGTSVEALLISGDTIFRCFYNGSKEPLH